MNENEFIIELNNLGINPTPEILNKLNLYCDYLLEYNKSTNLTAIKTKEEVYLKHFYDSITIVKAIDLSKVNNILDIGTGAGFPGMVLKIIFPNLNMTLLDSNNKKLKFLESLSKKLNIKVTLINERAEDYIKNHREEYDVVTSRAVADLRILSELAIPFLKVNGFFIPLKAEVVEELKESKKILTCLSSKVIKVISFNLPINNHKRTILIIKKEKKSNDKYPRSYSKILKD